MALVWKDDFCFPGFQEVFVEHQGGDRRSYSDGANANTNVNVNGAFPPMNGQFGNPGKFDFIQKLG